MRHLLRLSPVLLLLFMIGCNNKYRVNLADTNAKDEVPTLGNLTFLFDKNLAPDTAQTEWDSTEYIRFEPPIEGRFRWENANELVFSPESELPPATTFKATITKKILQWNPKLRLGHCEIAPFHTRPLQLDNALAMWNIGGGSAASAFPQIDLYFNYPVSPDKLKSLLHIKLDGVEKDFNIQNTTAAQTISLSLMNIKLEDRDLKIALTIAKGLLPEKGNTPTDAAIETNLDLISPFTVMIQNVEANHDGTQGTVKVYMSQSPVAQGLEKFIRFDPPVKFQTKIVSEGMIITSEGFDATKAYTLNIAQGLKGNIGGTLKEDYSQSITFGKLEPDIHFVSSKGVYLDLRGHKNIEVNITSVPKVKVIISKIYENNLLASSYNGYYPDDDSYNNDYEGDDYGNNSERGHTVLGDIIYQKVIDTKDLPRYGSSRLFSFNFQDKLKAFKGIYHIRIQSMDQYWLSDSRFVSLSDIGLIAKANQGNIYVFVNSIKTAKAITGVHISAYGYNNQFIGSGITDHDGVASIAVKSLHYQGFQSAMITATSGDDFNYLPFNTTEVNTSRFDVGGKHNNATNLDVFAYSERDIYRPGEKMNFSVIVRDWHWTKPDALLLKMKLLLPNGKELTSLKKSLNSQGSLETQIALPASAVTGSYTFEVYSANDILIASKNILVEEFMPDRIKVSTETDKTSVRPGETVLLSISAENLFGTPAARRNYEVEIQTKEKTFRPKQYEKYNFNLADQQAVYEHVVNEGTTNDQGKATEKYTAPEEYKNRGTLQVDFYTTVFDETGRPVNRKSSLDVYTQDVFYGLATDGYYYYRLNQNVSFPIIALNKDGKPQTALAHIQVIKHEYHTYLSKYGDNFRYDSRKEDKTIIDQEVTVNGTNSAFNFVPRTPGEYEIRIGAPGVNSYVKSEFYSYGSWGSYGSGFEVNNEGNVDIVPDKNNYDDNEKARILFKTPFDGKMLVTIETDKVLDYRYINAENRSASMELNLKSDYLPNAYITATLIKPHEESDMPLTVAHGFKSITVQAKGRKIPVTIIAESKVRSRTHQHVRVIASPNCKVTLAAVDEGILQVTDYKTPDPYGYFYGKRALAVNSFDLYPLLFPELKGTISSTGGDGFNLTKRTNPIQNKRVKLVSYWSGITDANGKGEANFDFDIPQFSGQIRLMAVAYKDASFGSADFKMTVADPIIISTALPRFLSPGDTVLMPVTVTNTTANNTNTEVHIKLSGPLRMIGDNDQSVSLKANNENRLLFKLTAEKRIDAGKVSVEVNGMNEKFLDETDITVRPAASLQKRTGSGAINAGGTAHINFGINSFIPSSADYQLIVGKNPILDLGDQIFHLVQYPYGCTEQTISAAFPQLYFGDLSDLMNLDPRVKSNANFNVQEAIRKIKMRQLYNGAITLWDNEGSENWWTSVYAAHFLLEARKAGFDVDNSLLDNIFTYLIYRLRNHETINYYYNRTQQKKIAPKEVAYSLYVLALAGKQQVSAMNYYKENSNLLALDSKYLLSAAYALAGDRGKFADLLPTSFSGETANRETGGSFYSATRDEAIALNALLEVDPNNPQVGVMAKHLSQQLKSDSWFSTQDRAFSFLALGKIARTAAQSKLNVTVKVGGKQIASNDGSTLRLTSKQLGGTDVELSATGTGKLYYFWQAEGISNDGSFKEEDSYLRVRKKFYDRYGHILSGNSFKQNDLVIVGITLENAYSQPIDNVVITDMLPAGFEIENPRTQEIPGMDWIKDAAQPTQLDVRDDRINLFVNLGSKAQTYYYAVRAVSPGTFTMGPVMADAMYNGEYHSYNGGRIIRIGMK